eukprot:TRINITY_DN9904_c0_g1_i1.p1 TRINITY_DN9904_c0_g1~~TRINITY_DN9904_c0_g1_i1.p1  ORF type:complete len:224 (-),score=22.92 TRINITY_DN9904_c0_g1_i1:94-723(-)
MLQRIATNSWCFLLRQHLCHILLLIVRKAVDLGICVCRQITDKNKELRRLSQEDDVEGVQRTLRSGAGIDSTGSDGKTPLMLASEAGAVGAMKVLLETAIDAAGATAGPLNDNASIGESITIQDFEETTQIVEKFMDKRSSKNNYNALMFACKYGQSEAAKLLLDTNARVNATDKDGNTVLHIAIYYGRKNTSTLFCMTISSIRSCKRG